LRAAARSIGQALLDLGSLKSPSGEGITAPVGVAWFFISLVLIDSMSTAWYSALRTRTSLNGFLPFTLL
jgi:hypothetical protein